MGNPKTLPLEQRRLFDSVDEFTVHSYPIVIPCRSQARRRNFWPWLLLVIALSWVATVPSLMGNSLMTELSTPEQKPVATTTGERQG